MPVSSNPGRELLESCEMIAALIPILRSITVRQVVDLGDDAIRAVGLNPYCMNEGRATGNEQAIDEWKLQRIVDAIAKAKGEVR